MSALRSFDSISDALDAAAVVPCDPLCSGVHVIAWPGTGGRVECEFVNSRPVRSLADELRLAGYRRPNGQHCPPPQYWPTPPALNGRLRP
jgi:hypothetical protein